MNLTVDLCVSQESVRGQIRDRTLGASSRNVIHRGCSKREKGKGKICRPMIAVLGPAGALHRV